MQLLRNIGKIPTTALFGCKISWSYSGTYNETATV